MPGALTSVTVSKNLTSIGANAFQDCKELMSLMLPESVTDVGCNAFLNCVSLCAVAFNHSVSPVFIAWAIGNSRNRANWQYTPLKRLRNVVRLITVMTYGCKSINTLDPYGSKDVFKGCSSLTWYHRVLTKHLLCIISYNGQRSVLSHCKSYTFFVTSHAGLRNRGLDCCGGTHRMREWTSV